MPEAARQIDDEAALREALAAPLFVLLKHSPICPVSDHAMKAFVRFADAHPDVPAAWLDVIGQRPLSRLVESTTGIRHESPQLLVFRDGRAAWHASHFDVKTAAIADAVASEA